jgi:hypothetical protein
MSNYWSANGNITKNLAVPNNNPLKNFEEAKFASKSHGNIISYAANTH